MRMDKKARGLAALFALLAAGLLASAPASAQISSSKHNLGSGDALRNTTTSGTDEICVFCHTPHGGVNTGGVPLWNKGLPSGTSYTMYSSSTMDGAAANLTGSVSLACLSCHDGSQAMDNMINAPGSGNYNSGGATQGYTWAPGSAAEAAVGTAGATLGKLGSGVTNLTTDLSNDHPIGIRYCAATGVQGSGNITACTDKDFNIPTKASSGRWFVETAGGAASLSKNDMILYTRATDETYVECASCHDPHNTTNGTFLRYSNAQSGVCLACHNK